MLLDANALVHCTHNDTRTFAFDIKFPGAIGQPGVVDHDAAVEEAKVALQAQGLAKHPYEGWTFKVEELARS